MTVWTGRRVAEVLSVSVPEELLFACISTDTRGLEHGALFVALGGDRFDGHEFLDQARDRGALAAVVRTGTPPLDGLCLIEVPDTKHALGLLAGARRSQFSGPVVAITGTNGKTSTREMVAAALRTRWNVHVTRENRNNLVGVPLTLLEAPDNTEALVVEVGSSEVGEVGRLRDVIVPAVAVVTNVSVAHLEGFGTLAAVINEKLSLLDGADLAIVGGQPESLLKEAQKRSKRAVAVSLGPETEVHPDEVTFDDLGRPTVCFMGEKFLVPAVGRHQAVNAMFSLAVAREFELDLHSVSRAFAAVELPTGRCGLLEHRDMLIVDDSYNANPASVIAALDAVKRMRGERRLILVLGSMLELGEESKLLHEQVARRAVGCNPDLVIAVGEFQEAFSAYVPALGKRLVYADDAEEAAARLSAGLEGGELILLKGSRGVHLERVAALITRE